MNGRPRMHGKTLASRDALDAIMENFDVIPLAKAGLDEEDRAWFSETLAKELRQLENLPRYEAGMTGSGKTTFVRDLVRCLADPGKRNNPA